MTTRNEQRAAFATDLRVVLLEQDVDELTAAMAELRSEVRAIRQLATGILTALVVASIMLAINLAVAR